MTIRIAVIERAGEADGGRFVRAEPGTTARIEEAASLAAGRKAHPGCMVIDLGEHEGARGVMVEWDDWGSRQHARRWDGLGFAQEVVGTGTIGFPTAGAAAGAVIAGEMLD